MKVLKRFLFLALVSVALVACGGGSSDNNTTDTIDNTDTVVTPDNTITPDTPKPDVTTELPPADVTGETAQEVACTPDCAGKECGPNGCGGFCGEEADGTCPNPDELPLGDAPFCISGKCVTFCSPFPEPGISDVPPYTLATAIPVGVMDPATMSIPGLDNLTNCFDYNSDGTPDNGLANLNPLYLTLINGQLTGLTTSIMLQFEGTTAYANVSDFTLNGLMGEAGTTDYVVYDQSYADDGTRGPIVSFPGSEIAAGELAAGPSVFSVSIPLYGIPLNLTLYDAQIKGSVTGGDATGIALTGGAMGGWLSRAEVEYILVQIDTLCASEEPPDLCGYYTSFKAQIETELPKVFDLDRNSDGVMDAASACLLFNLNKGKITAHVTQDWSAE